MTTPDRLETDAPDETTSSEEPVRPKFGLTTATLCGLPELDYFESDSQREAALREIEAEASDPKSFDFWFGVMLTAAAPILAFLLSRAYLRRIVSMLGVIGLDRAIEILLVAAVAWWTVRTLHRRGLISAVREKLISRQIPVCRRCGYLLRGLGPMSRNCPECGRVLDQDVTRILGHASEPEP